MREKDLLCRQYIALKYLGKICPSLKEKGKTYNGLLKDQLSIDIDPEVFDYLSKKDIEEIIKFAPSFQGIVIPDNLKTKVEVATEEEFEEIPRKMLKGDIPISSTLINWFLDNKILFRVDDIELDIYNDAFQGLVAKKRDDIKIKSSLSSIYSYYQLVKKKLNRRRRDVLMNAINRFMIEHNGVYHFDGRYRNLYFEMAHFIHPYEYSSKYPEAVRLFNELQGNDKSGRDWSSELKRVYEIGNVPHIIHHIQKKETEFVQRFESLVKLCEEKGVDVDIVLDALQDTEIGRRNLLWLYYRYYKKKVDYPRRVTDRKKLPVLENTNKAIYETVQDIIVRKIYKRIKNIKSNKKIYISPELKYIPLLVNSEMVSIKPENTYKLEIGSELKISSKEINNEYPYSESNFTIYDENLDNIDLNSSMVSRKAKNGEVSWNLSNMTELLSLGARYIVITYESEYNSLEEKVSIDVNGINIETLDGENRCWIIDLETSELKSYKYHKNIPMSYSNVILSFTRFHLRDHVLTYYNILQEAYKGCNLVSTPDEADEVIDENNININQYLS